MSCDQIQEQMQQWLFEPQRRPARDAEWSQHLSDCPECLSEWHRLQTLADAIQVWRANLPRIDIADRVMSRAGQSEWSETTVIPRRPAWADASGADADAGSITNPSRTSRSSLIASLAGLAALVVIVAVFDQPPNKHRPSGSATNVGRVQGVKPTAVASDASPDVRVVMAGVGSAYLALVQDTAGVVNSATAMALPVGFRSENGTADAVPGVPWLEGVGRGWEPIQKSVGNMIDTFLKPALADDPSQT